MSEFQGSMLGRRCPEGLGGRDCSCCGQALGDKRVRARRKVKRTERQGWKRRVRDEMGALAR